MSKLNPIQSKVSCIFESNIIKSESSKRPGQNYKCVASKELCKNYKSLIESKCEFIVTEKLDGTCCFISDHQGVASLFARLDKKPNKAAEKRLKKHMNKYYEWYLSGTSDQQPTFNLDYNKDMKSVPLEWFPASSSSNEPSNESFAVCNRHIVGWVPISIDCKQYVWHHQVVENDRVLVIQTSGDELELVDLKLCDLKGKTFELVGTNVNGNPYNVGNKQKPFHFLVEHGSIAVHIPDLDISYGQIKDWFMDEDVRSKIEGLVWHFSDGSLFKLHRHHLDLKWPLEHLTSFSNRPITVRLQSQHHKDEKDFFKTLRDSNGKRFESLHHLSKISV